MGDYLIQVEDIVYSIWEHIAGIISGYELTTHIECKGGNTVNEASTFGVLPLHGAYRAFPETLFNEARHLYVPWSVDDALSRLIDLLVNPIDTKNICQRRVIEADKCIDRSIDILEGKGDSFLYKDR